MGGEDGGIEMWKRYAHGAKTEPNTLIWFMNLNRDKIGTIWVINLQFYNLQKYVFLFEFL